MHSGLHVGIIMDGNGRWARARGLPRIAGHREGAKAVRRTIETAPEVGITTLTLYAFSADNWQRPPAEVQALMELLERYLRRESVRCVDHGIRINVIGRRDRLPARVLRAVEDAERLTAHGAKLHLRLAIDYSGRDAIARAAALAGERATVAVDDFGALINRAIHSSPAAPPLDLLIRTSGEQRLSDFMLWEVAYAELFFTDVMWPAFGKRELKRAIREFHRRERRFGGLLEHAV